MTTAAAVKRALEEAYEQVRNMPRAGNVLDALDALIQSPTALTILANRLSDRGGAGNAAARRNLAILKDKHDAFRTLMLHAMLSREGTEFALALEWAIDQLTPPVSTE